MVKNIAISKKRRVAAIIWVRTDFSEKIQDFFKTFSRPKVKNSTPKKKPKQCYKKQKNNATCLSAVNTQSLLLLRQPSGKHALKGVHMHAYFSTCHGFETVCSLDRAIDRADGSITRSRKEHSEFQDEIRREIAHRHCHIDFVEFECTARSVARCGHGHWTQAPLRSAEHLIVEEDE